MIRATTPKHIFTFETDPSDFARILITYAQNGEIVMEKNKEDLQVDPITIPSGKVVGYNAWFRMTQEETKAFKAEPGKQVSVQVRVLTYAGEALASEKRTISVLDVLNDEVLV